MVEISDDLRRNLILLGVCLLLAILFVGAKNYITPEDRKEVGYIEVYTECRGIESEICLGVQVRDHETFNYNNYTEPEEGTENFYRKVESELMIRAYDACDSETSGMGWTDEVSYRNRTASKWQENENIDLLPCEQTFYRDLDATE
jgi:hypothetical protein